MSDKGMKKQNVTILDLVKGDPFLDWLRLQVPAQDRDDFEDFLQGLIHTTHQEVEQIKTHYNEESYRKTFKNENEEEFLEKLREMEIVDDNES